MSESPKTAAAAPYTPSGAAASERMLSSVLGRVVHPYGAPIGRSLSFADRLVAGLVDGAGPSPGRGPAQRLFASPVFGPTETGSAEQAERPGPRRERVVPTKDLLTAGPAGRQGSDLKLPRSLRPTMALASPERMFGSDSKNALDRSPPAGEAPAGQPVLSAGWEPPAAHAARELSQSAETGAPLWGSLPRPTLEPLIAAVESDLGRAEVQRSEPPAMQLLPGGSGPRPGRSSSSMTEDQAHQLALESSKRLMDAVRAHARANGGSDDRISLGDMQLIAFADSNNQMAAASSFTSNAPDPQHAQRSAGDLPHPKIEEGLPELHKKLQMMAKLVAQDLKQVQKLSKERFGDNG